MENADLMQALLGLAQDAGLEVRLVGATRAESESPPVSGTCRLRGALWVVLATSDPLEVRLGVLANALRAHASPLIEGRYLPPAVRQLVSPERDSSNDPSLN